MAAELGNQLWRHRSKHGRDKIFETPDFLWQCATEYFKWCDDNPWEEQDWVGKDGDEVIKNKIRPYTLSGLCVYLDCGEQTLRDYSKRNDYSEVYTRIEQIIRTQKFEGAATGFFNASIIARDLGLVDKQEAKQTGELKHTVSVTIIKSDTPLANSEKDIMP